MSAVVTAHTSSARLAARTALLDGLRDVGLSQDQLAGALEIGSTRVGHWVSGKAHTPLYLLAHALVPAGLRDRLRALAPAASRCATTAETAGALLVGDVGALLVSLGAALSDWRLSPDERRMLAPLLRQLRARVDQLLAQLGSAP